MELRDRPVQPDLPEQTQPWLVQQDPLVLLVLLGQRALQGLLGQRASRGQRG